MPPAIAAAAVTAISVGVTYASITYALIAFVASLALSFISQALAPKPKRPQLNTQDRMIAITQAISTRTIAFGITRMSGVRTFIHSTGTSKEFLHQVITMTGHRTRRMVALILNDEEVPIDEDGNATGKYAGFVSAYFGNGTTAGDEAFHAALQENCPDKWTSTHRQTGCTKLYVRLKYSTQIFPTGVPNPSAIVEAYDSIYDPRTEETGFTDNWALCVAHYLRLSEVQMGLGATAGEIDDADLIQAANDCDEIADRKPAQANFTVDADTLLITPADASARLRLGTRVRVANTGGALPTPLQALTDYYWTPAGVTSGELAASLADARAGTTIVLSDVGSGTNSIQATGEPRYTCNGMIDSAETPRDILERLLTAGAGRAIWAEGSWHIFAGVYRAPSLSFDLSNLDGAISTRWLRSGQELANGIRGVFSNTDDLYIQTDYPAIRNPDYEAEDGDEERFIDFELAFTNSPSMAQRIAKIALEKLRRQIRAVVPLNLSGMAARAMDTVAFTYPTLGWDAKTFEVASLTVEPRGEDEKPHIGVTLVLEETDADVYAWDAVTEERVLPAAAYTDLPDPFDVAPPSNLLLFPEIIEGAIFLRAEWDAADDAFVVDYQVQHRLSPTGSPPDDPEWTNDGLTGGALTLDVGPLTTGVDYDVRVRSVSNFGLFSDWISLTDFPADGDETAPDPPTVGTPVPGSASIIFTGTADDVYDQASVQMFYSPDPNTDPSLASQFGGDFSYGAGAAISIEVTGLSPEDTYNAWFKAKDAYGNQSGFSTMMTATTTGGGGDGDGG